MIGFLSTSLANSVVGLVLLVMLVVLVGAVIATRSLLAAILMMTLFSLLSAVWLLVMDAADVAFTEAVVGAGVSTVLLLGAILLVRSEELSKPVKRMIIPALASLAGAGLLLYAAVDLPDFGDPASPANAYTGRDYLERGPKDIGPDNTVTSVLSSYRGFDTLGETTVIFAAGLAVALLLGFGDRALGADPAIRNPIMRDAPPGDGHVVLRVMAKLLIPLIALYAFYVQFHGDYGAGGGFQAGVILASAVILHALVFSLRETMAGIRPGLVRAVSAGGVLLFAGIGVINMMNGGEFLNYDHLFPPGFEDGLPGSVAMGGYHHWGQHFGILLIEFGVLLTVSSTVVSMFYGFAGRAPEAVEVMREDDA